MVKTATVFGAALGQGVGLGAELGVCAGLGVCVGIGEGLREFHRKKLWCGRLELNQQPWP